MLDCHFLAQNSQWPCEVAHYRPKPTSLGPETFGKVQWTANGSRERTDRAMRLSQIHLLQKCLVPPEAIGLGGIDQPIDLGAGQVLAGPVFGIPLPSRCGDCSIYSGWCRQFQR